MTVNPAKAPAAEEEEDVDLFGSESEDENSEAVKVREARLAEYKAKKEKKPKAIQKSLVSLEVKPWDDETDMAALEASVRAIEKDGLVWGLSKLVPVGYGVSKLHINLVVEDDKVSLDELQEEIQEIEDYVQSSDVVSTTCASVFMSSTNNQTRPLCRSSKMLMASLAGDATTRHASCAGISRYLTVRRGYTKPYDIMIS